MEIASLTSRGIDLPSMQKNKTKQNKTKQNKNKTKNFPTLAVCSLSLSPIEILASPMFNLSQPAHGIRYTAPVDLQL